MTSRILPNGFLLILLIWAVLIPSGSLVAETEREAELERQVEQLKAQLESANRTIAELKGQGDEPQPATITNVAAQDATKPSSPPNQGLTAVLPEPAGAKSNVPTFATGLNLGEDPGDKSLREEEIATTPMAITRLSAADLLLGGVEDTSRLEYLVPSLRYGQTGHDVRLAMRGARTNSVGAESDAAVAIYEDGVYFGTTTEGRAAYFDVESVEVLRGPQVTNFGQHAYAGAVSVVSNKPNFDGISGYAEAENGLPDKTRWRLALNVPLGDKWAVRLAGVSESRAGLIDNYYVGSDADDMNNRMVQSIRASVLWQPSDSFSMLFLSRYQDENGTGSAPWGYQQIGAYVDGEYRPGHQFLQPGASSDPGPWTVGRNFISTAGYENWVNTLDLNWDMGFANLRWLSNYTSFHGKQAYDNDYSTSGDVISSPFAGWETSQLGWSSELRLSSQSDSAFNWLAALYASDRSAEWGWLESVNGDLRQPSWDQVGEYQTDTFAAFGQATYEFTDRFSVTGGLRWNQQKKTYKNDAEGKWDEVLWKAALEYLISDRTMTYFSASTGYRPGGVNTAPGVNLDWDPEKLTAYEVGLKTRMANDRVTLNVAAFYNDFSDVQSQSFLTLPYPGSPEATEYTGNGGSADAKGVEMELQWRPMEPWNVAAQLTYTDASFGNYSTANLPGLGDIPGHTMGDTLSYQGWRPALTPEWVFGLQTSYTFQLKRYGSITPYLQTSFVSDYYANDINLAGVRQGSYSLTDVRIIWLLPNENFQLQFYHLNSENEAVNNWARVYSPAARPEITTLQGNWGRPTTYGIIFNYSF